MKNLIITIILILTIVTGFTQDKKTERFVDEYLEAAIWKIQQHEQPLIKWQNTEEIKYKILGDLDFISEKSFDKYLLEIEKLTGIKFIPTQENDFNLLIFFGDLRTYAQLTSSNIPVNAQTKFNNWSNRKWDKNHSIINASFCIVPDKINSNDEGVHRVKKGLLKSLGLLGDLNDEYSMFYEYPRPTNTGLSRKDKRIVKLHYNTAVKSGISKSLLKKTILSLPNIAELAKEKL